MPARIRNRNLAAALEAIIRYAEAGDGLRYDAAAHVDGSLRLTFTLDHLERYQAVLREVAREFEVLDDHHEQQRSG